MNYLPIIESEEMDLIMQLFFETSPGNDDPDIHKFKKWIRGKLIWNPSKIMSLSQNEYLNLYISRDGVDTVTTDTGFRINWRRWGQGDWYKWPTRDDLERMHDRHQTTSRHLRDNRRDPTMKGIPIKKHKPIEWKNKNVDFRNVNTNLVSLNNFKNGNKAIKFKATNKNVYLSPNSFAGLARKSMQNAYNMNSNAIVFKNPITRENVRRGDIEFVILKKKNNR